MKRKIKGKKADNAFSMEWSPSFGIELALAMDTLRAIADKGGAEAYVIFMPKTTGQSSAVSLYRAWAKTPTSVTKMKLDKGKLKKR